MSASGSQRNDREPAPATPATSSSSKPDHAPHQLGHLCLPQCPAPHAPQRGRRGRPNAPSGGAYLNDGKGRFTPGSRIGAGGIEKVRLADFDFDGDLDIFLACIGPDLVCVNDGRGGFTDAGMRLGKDWSWELAVGDFNGDRLPDVFVASFGMNRAAPPDQQVVARPLEVWLNTSSRPGAAAPARK
jgi:hypothetical protein